MASTFAIDHPMATLPAWASFLTAPAGPCIHTDPRLFRARRISPSWTSSALRTLLRQGVPDFLLGGQKVYSGHPCFRGSEGCRHEDLARIQRPGQPWCERSGLLPLLVLGDLQNDASGHSFTHPYRVDANLGQRDAVLGASNAAMYLSIIAKALGAGSIVLTISVAPAAMDLATSLSIFTCVPLRLQNVSATLVTSEARRSSSAPMSDVVDVLISSANSVGSSGDSPVFLFFARGVSTAQVSSSSVVSSIRRLPVFSAEQKRPSLRGTVFLILLLPACVGSAANSASPSPLMVSSASLFSPTVVSFFPHWAHKMATYTRACHYRLSLALWNGSRDALSAFFSTGTRPSLWLTSLFEFSSFPGDFDQISVLSTTAPCK